MNRRLIEATNRYCLSPTKETICFKTSILISISSNDRAMLLEVGGSASSCITSSILRFRAGTSAPVAVAVPVPVAVADVDGGCGNDIL